MSDWETEQTRMDTQNTDNILQNNIDMIRLRYDLFIIGANNVGKQTFINKIFDPLIHYKRINNCEMYYHIMTHNGQKILIFIHMVTILAFDSTAMNQIFSLESNQESNALNRLNIIIFDVTNRNSFNHHSPIISGLNGDTIYVFNKNDLANKVYTYIVRMSLCSYIVSEYIL